MHQWTDLCGKGKRGRDGHASLPAIRICFWSFRDAIRSIFSRSNMSSKLLAVLHQRKYISCHRDQGHQNIIILVYMIGYTCGQQKLNLLWFLSCLHYKINFQKAHALCFKFSSCLVKIRRLGFPNLSCIGLCFHFHFETFADIYRWVPAWNVLFWTNLLGIL